MIKLSEVNPAEYNPRTISDKELKKLEVSLEKFGAQRELIINRKTGNLVSGHQMLQAAKNLGMEKLPVRYVDVSKDDEIALNLAMNTIGGEFDSEKLYDVIEKIRQKEAIKFTGFDEKDVSKIMDMKLEMEESIADPEEHEELEPVAKVGDIYELGEHRLMCGDCINDMESLMGEDLADMIWTDPPYNVNYESSHQGKIKNDKMSDSNFAEFTEDVFMSISQWIKKGAVSYICTGWQSFAVFQEKMEIAGLHLSEVIIWVKNRGGDCYN